MQDNNPSPTITMELNKFKSLQRFHRHIGRRGHDSPGHAGLLRSADVAAGVGGLGAAGVFLRPAPCGGCGPHRSLAER